MQNHNWKAQSKNDPLIFRPFLKVFRSSCQLLLNTFKLFPSALETVYSSQFTSLTQVTKKIITTRYQYNHNFFTNFPSIYLGEADLGCTTQRSNEW